MAQHPDRGSPITWNTVADLPVHPSWEPALEPVMPQIQQLGQFLNAEVAAGRGYLPAHQDIFRAFSYPLDEVKVLIVGQDPYPTPGHAMGLSFSTQPGVHPLPRSLSNIFKELVADQGTSQDNSSSTGQASLDIAGVQAPTTTPTMPVDGDLTPWSHQGVMLLNRVLTVAPGDANSHKRKGWEKITEAAITALGKREHPLVAILWGRQAQEVQKFLGDVPCITSAHPSPLSASRGFFGSRPFSNVNTILANLGATPVDWQL